MGIDTSSAATAVPPLLRSARGELPKVDELAAATAEAGLAALFGEPGDARDSLICAAAPILWHLRRFDSQQDAAAAVREVLDNGEALRRLNSE